MQLPFMKHGGNTVADSAFIIKYLEATYGTGAMQPLDGSQQAISSAFACLIMDRLQYGIMYHLLC